MGGGAKWQKTNISNAPATKEDDNDLALARIIVRVRYCWNAQIATKIVVNTWRILASALCVETTKRQLVKVFQFAFSSFTQMLDELITKIKIVEILMQAQFKFELLSDGRSNKEVINNFPSAYYLQFHWTGIKENTDQPHFKKYRWRSG